ncbi:hypothetical protein B9Z55_007999 [Caenorhabditis nigoni]|uniref:Uncharacterized protein n=1 Tax=Caenorhabditis nigoni TaxID=1611254 RepID=A0A2G5VCS5_9PELO|nr:hypothetical protein B9Z55_007999 [Caenorhabditis nigoni]
MKHNFRLYIVSQVPEFRKVEKSLPLNLDTLCISSSGIRLNESDYRLSPCTPELRKILENPPYNLTSFGFGDSNKTHVAFKKVIHQLIGDRPMICTRELELCDLSQWENRGRRDLKIYQLPMDLKLRAEMLETSGISVSYANLDLVSNILGSKPLKELSIRLDNYQIIQHPIVRNSQKLVLWSGRADFDRQRIPHKNIYLKDNNQFLAYSDEWIRNQNEIGMEFSGDVGYRYPDTWKMVSEESIKRIMYLKKCQSGGRSVKADERQYICSQIPEIRNSEKSLSLHLNYLAISDVKIRLDQNEYYLDRKGAYSIWTPVYEWDCEKRKEVLPGDVCIGTPEPQELPGNAEIDPPGLPIELKMKRIPPPSEKENLLRRYLKNRRENAGMTDNLFKNLQTDNDNKTLVLFPPTYDSTPIHVAFKKLVFDLIGNRPIVYTKKLEFPKIKKKEFWIYRFPEDLKIQAEVLETDGFSFSYDDLDQISRILGPKPLKEFTTPLDNYEIFQHPIIRNSRKLVLSAGEVDFDHQRIQHRNIHLTDSKQLMNHINAWIRNPKDIGMEFSGDVESRRSIRIAMTYDVDLENISKEARIKEIMYGKKCRSGGRRVKADKRQYVVSQIPEFRKVEKSLPLHLDSLNIEIDKIQIDQCEYFLKRSNLCIDGLSVRQQWFYFYSPLKIPPVDFNQTHYPTEDLWNASPIGLRKRQIQNPPIDTMLAFFPSVYKNQPIQVAFVKLVFDLIGNRPMIYTKKLELLSYIGHLTREEMSEMIFILPLGLKIQAQTIKAKWNELSHGDLDRISNFLGPKPLEEFSTQLWGFENLTHPIVRNSQKLVLHSCGLVVNPQRINHRNIHLTNFGRQNFLNHMNAWIANVQEVGMEFSGHIKTPPEEFWWSLKYDIDEEEVSIKEMMYLKKCESGGRRVKPDER